MTTRLRSRPAHPIDDYCVSNAYVATIDADSEAAYETVLAIDPMSSLATSLRDLGVDDRAHVVESSEAARLSDARGDREYGFGLLWRFGASGETANIVWRLRFGEDGMGRTVLSITIRGRGSTHEAAKRITAAWPIVETIARGHAKNLRRAIDACTDDPREAEGPARRAVQSVAA